jgi:hypothetical protein
LADKRQTNAIIATAILDSIRDYPGHKVDREDAKINAKRILAALEVLDFRSNWAIGPDRRN